VKVLLDECIDRRLAKDLVGYEVKTVPQMGWATIKNGELLALAEQEFHIFLAVDRNLAFQQNLHRYNLVVIVFCAKTNRLGDLRSLMPNLLELLSTAKVGEVLWVRHLRH